MDTEPDSLTGVSKSSRVRAMFTEIAPRYDFLNHALPLNIDRRWRRLVIRKLGDALTRPDAIALDLCCGTADLTAELGARVSTIGLDFCRPMLDRGSDKLSSCACPVILVEGDALRVPALDESFDVITIAFGLRNLESVEAGLREIYRLLKRGGRAAVLEFSRPVVPVVRSLFNYYFTRILPKLGNAVSGSTFAYQYLPESVQEFPHQEALADLMRAVGFSNVSYYNLSGGITALHLGDKK
jgi:demethylmenaquinone methyltransferase/2-methoxy-6-polyprenyl-1,4-benzoquinol methylase